MSIPVALRPDYDATRLRHLALQSTDAPDLLQPCSLPGQSYDRTGLRGNNGDVNNRNLFNGRQFTAEVILWAVRWCLQFPINYRDLACMLADRGVQVDHTTLFRWIEAYPPEPNKRIRPRLRVTNGSWRVDEIYIRVKGKWVYLYRAVDAAGKQSTSCSLPGEMRLLQRIPSIMR